MIKVAAYLRLSKDDGKKIKESNSIDNQRTIIDIYIKSHPEMVKVGEYIDDGFTGLNFERDGYKKMLQDIVDKKIDLVLIKDFSRFGRKLNLVLNEIEKITDKKVNASIYSITEDLDALEDYNDIKFTLEIMLNEHYSANISKKILAEVKAQHSLGKFIGSHTSYGYKRDPLDKHHLVIDDYPASIVRGIFNEFLKGERGKQGIARDLNSKNILCPSAYKDSQGENYRNSNKLPATNQWTYSTINKVLQNQIYCGDMVQGKASYSKFKRGKKAFPKEEWCIVENTHEPVISKEIFFEVQELIKKNTRTIDFGNISLFAGFIKCNECGRALVKTHYNNKITYVCSTYKGLGKDQCTRHQVSEEILKKYILTKINNKSKELKNELNSLVAKSQEALNGQNNFKKSIFNLESNILKFENYKMKLLEKNADDVISDSFFKENYNLYEQKISQAKNELQKLNNKGEISALDNFKRNKIIMNMIDGHFTELTRELLITYIDSIVVSQNDDKININIRWKY